MRFVGTPIVDGGSIAWLWNAYLGEDRTNVSPYAAPARADELGGLPPTYVMTAELDPLRDEGVEYAMRLLHAGVSVELHQFAGAFHGFDMFPTAITPGSGRTGRLAACDHTTCAGSQGGNTMKRTRSSWLRRAGARSEHGAGEPDGGRRDRGDRGRGGPRSPRTIPGSGVLRRSRTRSVIRRRSA